MREMVVDLSERWDRKVGEVKMDRDAGCSEWDRLCHVGVGKCVCGWLCVCVGGVCVGGGCE